MRWRNEDPKKFLVGTAEVALDWPYHMDEILDGEGSSPGSIVAMSPCLPSRSWRRG
jgi:seryl-tRNA synthetase